MQSEITAAALVAQIDDAVARMEALVRGLTPEQRRWRPRADSWSVTECLDHLNRSVALYLKVMRVSFERERQNASLPRKSFRIGFLARQFVRFLEPPYRLRAKAVKSISPPSDLNPVEVEKEFYRLRLDLRGFVLEASHVDMGAIRFASPLAPILKFNLAEAVQVLAAHDRRHLWQAENVTKSPDFPSGSQS